MPTLWRKLLVEGRPDLSDAALQACVQRSQGDLRAVSLSLNSSAQFAKDEACLGACRQLEFLELPSGLGECHFFRLLPDFRKLKSLRLGLKIGNNRIGLALSLLPRLEHAEFLDVKPCHSADTWTGASLPNLRSLIIATCSYNRWHSLFLVRIPYYTSVRSADICRTVYSREYRILKC
jgi:hypothetical protein